LAQELRPDLLLLDDLEAREEAEHRDFAVMGTLGMLELAAERGLLDFSAAIMKLKATSFHMPV
jgi:predicted nucleic acid-binding protein